VLGRSWNLNPRIAEELIIKKQVDRRVGLCSLFPWFACREVEMCNQICSAVHIRMWRSVFRYNGTEILKAPAATLFRADSYKHKAGGRCLRDICIHLPQDTAS